jgi:hypothetical protein
MLGARERQKPDAVPGIRVSRNPGVPESRCPGIQVERISYPTKPHGIFGMAHWIAKWFRYRMPTLLWITEWSAWPNSGNWHLNYKLRHSYGDLRLLHETPGHLFLEHELEDLASFLQIAMGNGWGWLHLDPSGLRECILQPRRVHRLLCQTR